MPLYLVATYFIKVHIFYFDSTELHIMDTNMADDYDWRKAEFDLSTFRLALTFWRGAGIRGVIIGK